SDAVGAAGVFRDARSPTARGADPGGPALGRHPLPGSGLSADGGAAAGSLAPPVRLPPRARAPVLASGHDRLPQVPAALHGADAAGTDAAAEPPAGDFSAGERSGPRLGDEADLAAGAGQSVLPGGGHP